MSLFFVFYALGPAILGYSLAYLLKNPQDWTGPAIIIPLSAALTTGVYSWGTRRLQERVKTAYTFHLDAMQIGGLVMGLVVFGLMYFVLLD